VALLASASALALPAAASADFNVLNGETLRDTPYTSAAAAKAALVGALRRNQDAYRSLGRAASGSSRSRYNGAKRAIRRTETALTSALQALRGAGYKLK
jgi:hypothetical protein